MHSKSIENPMFLQHNADIGKLSTDPKDPVKKTGTKREGSPYNPLKRKARGKETRPGSCWNLCTLSPRARARAGANATCARERYAEAGAAADEVLAILGNAPRSNRTLWAFYCYHFDIGTILDLAYECASRFRQGEIKNPVTAFQHKLQERFPKGGAK